MSIFSTKVEMAKDAPERTDYGISFEPTQPKSDAPVRVTMTEAERRALLCSNFPRYDAMDVRNIQRNRFGNGY